MACQGSVHWRAYVHYGGRRFALLMMMMMMISAQRTFQTFVSAVLARCRLTLFIDLDIRPSGPGRTINHSAVKSRAIKEDVQRARASCEVVEMVYRCRYLELHSIDSTGTPRRVDRARRRIIAKRRTVAVSRHRSITNGCRRDRDVVARRGGAGCSPAGHRAGPGRAAGRSVPRGRDWVPIFYVVRCRTIVVGIALNQR